MTEIKQLISDELPTLKLDNVAGLEFKGQTVICSYFLSAFVIYITYLLLMVLSRLRLLILA